MPTRRTRLSDEFRANALQLFPRERSVGGSPSYGDFESGPLAAARAAFSIDFEAQAEFVVGVSAVRLFLTVPLTAFGPLVFTAVLVSDDVVELVDVAEDEGYWDLIAKDQLK